MSTTHTTYNPREGSLADRVLAFFTRQPDEELAIADIVIKFDAKVKSVKMCLKPTVQAGLIRWGQNEHGSWVYTAGPALQLKAERAREAAQQATHGERSHFLGSPPDVPDLPPPTGMPTPHNPFPVSRRHTLGDD